MIREEVQKEKLRGRAEIKAMRYEKKLEDDGEKCVGTEMFGGDEDED